MEHVLRFVHDIQLFCKKPLSDRNRDETAISPGSLCALFVLSFP